MKLYQATFARGWLAYAEDHFVMWARAWKGKRTSAHTLACI